MGDGMERVEDVLIVDDNPADIRFIEEAVEGSALDLTLYSATTADEALDFVQQTPDMDGVLVDWNLAQNTGSRVLNAVKTRDSSIPVIVMTGSQAKAREVQSSTPKADKVIKKGTKPEKYIEIIPSIF